MLTESQAKVDSLNGRPARMGMIGGGDFKACAARYPEKTGTEENRENLEHIWAQCVLGPDKKEEAVQLTT